MMNLLMILNLRLTRFMSFVVGNPLNIILIYVKAKYPENDQVYGMRGQHKIRKKVERRKYDAGLRKETIEKCKIIDNLHYKSDFYKELGVEQ